MNVQPPQLLMLPHFAHGKHVLTHVHNIVYNHQPTATHKMSRYGMVRISESNKGTEAVKGHVQQAFAHVETMEPLNIYKLW
jgi:hypothetical protein